MNITVNTDNRKRVTVSSTKEGVVSVINRPKNLITLQLFGNGLSTYQLAVRNGYTGTEADFAAESIHPIVDFTAYYILSKS